ncbi:MAG: TIGR02281 family clan AA aspartic protease, partial [Alphaproteobacteria bacterium HGW-Alphaproteobacteria-2]
MTGDDTAKLIYLVALGAVIGGWLLMQNRRRMGHLAQLAALWGFIFVGAI